MYIRGVVSMMLVDARALSHCFVWSGCVSMTIFGPVCDNLWIIQEYAGGLLPRWCMKELPPSSLKAVTQNGMSGRIERDYRKYLWFLPLPPRCKDMV